MDESERRRLEDELIVPLAERFLDADVEYREDPDWPGSDVFRGRDAVRRRFAEYGELVRGQFEVEDVIPGPKLVVAFFRYRGRGVDSGTPFDQPWAWVVEVHDGRISSISAYLDRTAALSTAGLG